MKKNAYQWVWKWHFIGGMVSFPIIFLLAATGIVYLFKGYYEAPIKEVATGKERLSYQHLWEIVQQQWDKPIQSVVLPTTPNQAIAFTSGRFSNKSSLFINPYTGAVTGSLVTKETDMYLIRKLHGELLLGRFGTKIVELIGSWMVVLIITGLFLFIPRKRKDWGQLFLLRTRGSKTVFFRDLHKVMGFWFSLILLIVLAGGMPWTDVFGDGFKWVQQQTNTGFPRQWQGRGISSTAEGPSVPLDVIMNKAESFALRGQVSIALPKSDKGVYSIHNTYHPDHSQQQAIHLDRYSGKVLLQMGWEEVGILMRGRMWAMAFHQGQFGTWNWVLMLCTAGGLLLLSGSAIAAYFLRKTKGSWGTPPKERYRVGYGFYAMVLIFALILPLFGLSVLLIMGYEQFRRWPLKSGKIENRSLHRS